MQPSFFLHFFVVNFHYWYWRFIKKTTLVKSVIHDEFDTNSYVFSPMQCKKTNYIIGSRISFDHDTIFDKLIDLLKSESVSDVRNQGVRPYHWFFIITKAFNYGMNAECRDTAPGEPWDLLPKYYCCEHECDQNLCCAHECK